MKMLLQGWLIALLLATGAIAANRSGDNSAHLAWPREGSGLTPDPAVRFGKLANGMRYAIMKNATPPGEASVRLRIAAGSLNEREDQRGLAHFLEHMVLNGTRNVPEGEFVHRLERAGLKFGPDTNASTDFRQTVYRLDLPETDEQTIDTALFLLREIADQASLDPAAIERERGVILAEERKRATPHYRMTVDEFDYVLKGDLLPRRLPIGDTEIIRSVDRAGMVEFYESYYRPERATLIAVGDFDVDRMEAKIRQQYGSWRGEGPSGAEVEPARLPLRKAESHIFVAPGLATRFALTWISPFDARPDSRGRREQRFVEQLGLQIINRRLERIAGSGKNPPFIAASASRGNYSGRAEALQMAAVTAEGKWLPALVSLEREQRRVVRYGFTDDELSREIAEFRAQLSANAAGEATRQSTALARALLGAVNEDEVFTSPATQLAMFDETVRDLKPEQVSAALQPLFSVPPLISLSAPQPVGVSEAALLAAYRQSRRSVPVGPPKRQVARDWPYTDFGAAGTVAEREEIEGLEASTVRFANGVRLTVKPTRFKDDQILVSVRFGSGEMGLPIDRASPSWQLTAGGFISGGLRKLTFEQLQRALASKVYGVDFGIDEDAFMLAGRTRPEDFATQMQVLAAFLTDAEWRAGGWNRLRMFGGTLHERMASTPVGVFNRDAAALLRSGDPRWRTPSREELESFSVSEGRELVEQALESGPIEVIIVGDVSIDEAIRQTALTFGALPPRAELSPSTQSPLRFPDAAIERRTHKGRGDQALAFIAWPTQDFFADQRRTRSLNVLAQVMQLRLREEIREKQGASYSPAAGHAPSEAFSGYGYLSARIEAPPESLDRFFQDVLEIAQALRDKPVSADELQRARQPLIESIQRQRAGNVWWLARLAGLHGRPERVDSIRRSIDEYLSLTPADLQRAARDFLVDAKAWRMIITPAKEGES